MRRAALLIGTMIVAMIASIAPASAYYSGQGVWSSNQGGRQAHMIVGTVNGSGTALSFRADGYACYNANAYIRDAKVTQKDNRNGRSWSREIAYTGSSHQAVATGIETSYIPFVNDNGDIWFTVSCLYDNGQTYSSSWHAPGI